MPEEVPHFIPPEIQNNPFGWGPCEMPDQFKDMPYQPFSKGDRIGKVCWSVPACNVYRILIVMFFLDIRLDRFVTRQEIFE